MAIEPQVELSDPLISVLNRAACGVGTGCLSDYDFLQRVAFGLHLDNTRQCRPQRKRICLMPLLHGVPLRQRHNDNVVDAGHDAKRTG
jgi:hypothetical protein